jgi:hypothetical protein
MLKIIREELTDTDTAIIIDENSEQETTLSYFESDLSHQKLGGTPSGKKLNPKGIDKIQHHFYTSSTNLIFEQLFNI